MVITVFCVSSFFIKREKIFVSKTKTIATTKKIYDNDEKWLDVTYVVNNEFLKSVQNKIKLYSEGHPGNFCPVIMYPVKIDGKYIKTYAEDKFLNEFLDVYPAIITYFTETNFGYGDGYISFEDDYKVLEFRNTENKLEYKQKGNRIDFKNAKGGIYILKLQIDDNNIVEVLFR